MRTSLLCSWAKVVPEAPDCPPSADSCAARTTAYRTFGETFDDTAKAPRGAETAKVGFTLTLIVIVARACDDSSERIDWARVWPANAQSKANPDTYLAFLSSRTTIPGPDINAVFGQER